MQVLRSALVDHSAERLFDVIEAAEHYPRFLPWCTGAVILQRDEQWVSADLQMRLAGLTLNLRTRNPKRRPEHMLIQLLQGPFQHFEGEWRLKPLMADACRVDFRLDYQFATPLLAQALGPLFNQVANAMVDAFVRRTQALAPGLGASAGMAGPPAPG